MRMLVIALSCGLASYAQSPDSLPPLPMQVPALPDITRPMVTQEKWRMTGNRWLSGSLVFLAGASKGFNETLMFHWKAFRHRFPNANPNWYNPDISWKNKYKNGDPDAGARFPLSTSFLVGLTDQYHLNTMINRVAWTSAIVIRIGEPRKPLKHYLADMLYYSLCHQAGFALTYYPFKGYKGN
jgi:hypothetical protein